MHLINSLGEILPKLLSVSLFAGLNHHCSKSWQNCKVFFTKILMYSLQLALEIDFDNVLIIFFFWLWRKLFFPTWWTQTYAPSNRRNHFTENFIKKFGKVCHLIRCHCPHQHHPSWKVERTDGSLKLNVAKFTETFKSAKSKVLLSSTAQLWFVS